MAVIGTQEVVQVSTDTVEEAGVNSIEGTVLILVPAERLDAVLAFPPVTLYLSRALNFAQGELDFETVLTELRNNRLALWIVIDQRDSHSVIGAFVTRIADYPTRRTLFIVLLGGKQIRRWVGHVETLAEYGRHYQAYDIELKTPRKGFLKLLERHGFKQRYLVIGKPIQVIN